MKNEFPSYSSGHNVILIRAVLSEGSDNDGCTGCRVTWNLSSVSLSPIWRSRSPLAWPMLPAAVSTVCLGCRNTHTEPSGCKTVLKHHLVPRDPAPTSVSCTALGKQTAFILHENTHYLSKYLHALCTCV